MKTAVFKVNPGHTDMLGNGHPYVEETGQTISQGLAKRIADYAAGRMKEMGLPIAQDWELSVETNDADQRPADRMYHVTWQTAEGAKIGIEGILTKRGWPLLDHGPFVHGC